MDEVIRGYITYGIIAVLIALMAVSCHAVEEPVGIVQSVTADEVRKG